MVALDGVTDRLKEHPENPKRGNLDAIEGSIDALGFYGAVLAQTSTGYILAGNHRYRKAIEKKAKEIPVIWIDVDDDTALRILLGDNHIAEMGWMDQEVLDAALSKLGTLEGTGYEFAAAVEDAIESNESGGSEGDEAATEVPGPDGIPDDEFESQFGVVVLCEDAEHQKEVYETLELIREKYPQNPLARTESRVVAI